MARLLTGLIGVYRAVLSPWLPQSCRFNPTCSSYALEAIRKHGAVKGGYLSILRLARCHPFHPGGDDPVP